MNKHIVTMRTLASTIALLLITSISLAQDYQPFNSSSSKRFFEAGNPSENNTFFHSTESNTIGDTTILSNYYTIFDAGIPGNHPECPFWGGPNGEYIDTTWLGTNLRMNLVSHELKLYNTYNESLTFDFSLAIGASSLFYSDGITEYFIEHTATSFETFLGVSDSVQFYTINAFNTSGTPLPSALNNFEIKLSKNYGLLSFIDCFDFPQILQGYELQGQTNPLIGSYQLTYDEAYPWQVGDVLQYFSTNTLSAPPAKQAYHTLTVTDRTETSDSVFITYDALIQETNTSLPSSWIYPINYDPIRFKKGDPIWERPWNSAIRIPNIAESGVRASEESITECSTKPQFVTRGNFITYCDSCLCYGGYDGFGTGVQEKYYTKDIGIYKYTTTPYGPLIALNGATLIYWNVNGEECGTFWNNQELFQFELAISPNPTQDILKVEADQAIESIRLLDVAGRTVLSKDQINLKTLEISLASFQKGAYILEITANGSTQKQTILKE